MRLGIDVGGTNTDAVLMNGTSVVAWTKSLTSEDVCSGIVTATESVLQKANISPSVVKSVMIGTTQFANALVERKALNKVGILRLALPSGAAIPAMSDWPEDLRECIETDSYYFCGGNEFDGREISPLDEQGVRTAARTLRNEEVNAFAITGAFSPVDSSMERRAADIIRSEMPDAHITLSSLVGRVGLLERENAAILNAGLAMLAQKVIESFRSSMQALNILAPVYISQNDGTLITTEEAACFPVMTIGSGPTNSMRGAAYLTGISDAIIIDVGGTTSDIGVLKHGFPRESTISVDIGGVRTNFRMPDTLAIGLGGGTIINIPDNQINSDHAQSEIRVGPSSVGYQLVERARIFGGDTLTATDIAVSAGKISLGTQDSSSIQVSDQLQSLVLDKFRTILEVGLDRMKTTSENVCVIVVGGGSFLVPESLKGAANVVRPEHGQVANAVGAAIAQVGSQVEQIFSYEKTSREDALKGLKQKAEQQLLTLGGEQSSIVFTEVEETFLSYLPGHSAQLRVKAVADLKDTGHLQTKPNSGNSDHVA